jgi:hypothetical protein
MTYSFTLLGLLVMTAPPTRAPEHPIGCNVPPPNAPQPTQGCDRAGRLGVGHAKDCDDHRRTPDKRSAGKTAAVAAAIEVPTQPAFDGGSSSDRQLYGG